MFSISIFSRASAGLGLVACAACAGFAAKPEEAPAPRTFYTVTAEIALARHEPRVAALQYAAAAAHETDPAMLARATQVAFDTLQPSLAEMDAARWMSVDPASLDAQRAAARAALAQYKIEPAALHYRNVLVASSIGAEGEFSKLEAEFAGTDDVFAARQVADRLAAYFPSSAAALRVQGFTALRADDPAAAVRSFTGALALTNEAAAKGELIQARSRARILAGDVDETLAAARSMVEHDATPANRLDYVLLLMTAQHSVTAIEQLKILVKDPQYAPVAMRLLGLIEFQDRQLDAAAASFAELLKTENFQEDAYYYLGLIADQRDDPEQALRLYAQVQRGENALPALLRATALLHKHGAAASADELLDRMVEDEPQRAPEILDARARIYAEAGDWPRASAVLQQALVDYPDSVVLHYAMASTEEEQGRIPAAIEELNHVLKTRPDDPAAWNALGYTLADHNQHLARARRLIERAYAAAPRNAAILDSLGWVLFRQGKTAEAQTYLRMAYADDHGGDIGAHLGEVMWRLGKPAEAEQIWTEASTADADNRLLKETRQRLHAERQ